MTFLRRLIDERLVIFAIVVNSVALFVLQAVEQHSAHGQIWFWIEYVCVIYFGIEQAVKIQQVGWRAHWRNRWDRFDFVLVLAGAPFLLMPVMDLKDLSGLLILRMSRLFRLFRLLRFVPDRDRVALGIARALKASMGVFLALLLVNFILAMGASMLFGDLAPEYFGHPLKACYSIFQVFTVEGWYEIPELIASRADSIWWAGAARAYFLASVLVGGILGLSLANAVFIDQMTLDNTNSLENRIDDLSDHIGELQREIRALGQRLGSRDED